eukprot:gene1001-240_t
MTLALPHLAVKNCVWQFLYGATLGKYYANGVADITESERHPQPNKKQKVDKRRLPRLPPAARRVIGSYTCIDTKYPSLKPQSYFLNDRKYYTFDPDADKKYYEHGQNRLVELKKDLDMMITKDIMDFPWNFN